MRGDVESRPESDRIEGLPHPRDTAGLFGHEAAEQQLLDAYRSGRLHHAWLIGGPRGIGKATLAWRFARFLLANPDPAAPTVRNARDLSVAPNHPVLARLRSGALGDVAVLRRAWNDKTKKFYGDIRVDDVREALQLFQRASGAGGFRICLIDSAEDLNRSSANALLKAIEEPPPSSLFLVVAHQPAQVMPTILSRCRKLILHPLADREVQAAIGATGLGLDELPPGELNAIVARSGGSVSRTLEALDPDRLAIDRELRTQLDRLPAVDYRALHRLADRLASGDAAEAGKVLLEAVLDWLDARVAQDARAGATGRNLAPLAEVWDKVHVAAREAEALNLDKRPLLLSMFGDLAQAMRDTGPLQHHRS